MDVTQCIDTMVGNGQRVAALVGGVTAAQSRWRPSEEEWSILEVVNHLYDEEQYDFRVRLDIILHHPQRPWPKIDPQGWVSERDYNGQALDTSLQNFLQERAASLDWLRGLQNPDWEATYKPALAPCGPGICWPPGWPTTCSTCANWSNSIGPTRWRNWHRMIRGTPVSGNEE